MTTTTVVSIDRTIYGEPIRTVPPAVLAVPLDAALSHSRIGHNPNDLDVAIMCLEAAIQEVEQYAGLGLITQTWQQTFSAWNTNLALKRRPLIAVGSPAQAVTITYLDGDNEVQELATSDYAVWGIGGDKVDAIVQSASSVSGWPTLYSHPAAITVTYTVGYGLTPASVPPLIRHAVLLEFGKFYEFRESASEVSASELSFASKALLRDWRPLAVA